MKPINGQRIECFDDDARCPGLLIRVNANGTKTWSLLYRTKVGNTLRRYTIGRFPEISLAKARALAIDALADVRAGDDPASGRRADREAMLFPALVKDFLATKSQKRSVGEYRRVLNKISEQHGWKRKAVREISAEAKMRLRAAS